MTLLRPAKHSQCNRATALGERDRSAVERLVGEDPLVNAVVCARLQSADTLSPSRLGGTLIGVRDGTALAGAALSGGNLSPLGGDDAALRAIADLLLERPRTCSAIVGRADLVSTLWAALAPRWGPARSLRPRQPLLVLDRSCAIAGEDRVRAVRPEELERYLPAATAMFTEELGIAPRDMRRSPFRLRIASLIAAGHAFAVFDGAGQVGFKADIAAVSPHTCQVQGVWVRPDLRGRGLGTAALAAVLRHGLTLAPTVSLYVNDFNAPARRVYEKLGMRQHATLATVLL